MLDHYRFACDTSDPRQEAVHEHLTCRPGPGDARDDTEQPETDRACAKGEQDSVPARSTIMPAHCVAAVRSFAQAETYNFTEYDDIVVHMKKITDYLGSDVAIDAAGAEADGNLMQHISSAKLKLQGGSPIALNWAIDSVRKGGTVSVMGAYGPMFSAVKFGDAMNKGLTLRMNQCPVKRQWPRLFDHVRNGYLKPSEIVTHRFPLDDINEAYHTFSAKLDNCIKPLIVPNGH